MTFYFPAPIPDDFLNDGKRAFSWSEGNNRSEMMDIRPKDAYAEELKIFFNTLDNIRLENSGYELRYAFAALTNNNIVEDSKIFNIRRKHIAQIGNKNAYLLSPELFENLYHNIVKDLAIKRDKELVKAFLYTESILFLNLIQKSKKLKRSYGYIINNSFYKAYSMRVYAIKYSKILFGNHYQKLEILTLLMYLKQSSVCNQKNLVYLQCIWIICLKKRMIIFSKILENVLKMEILD